MQLKLENKNALCLMCVRQRQHIRVRRTPNSVIINLRGHYTQMCCFRLTDIQHSKSSIVGFYFLISFI